MSNDNSNDDLNNKKIAIIGGGLAGLAAATELYLNNQEFTLFEASSKFGGKLKTIDFQGYKLDFGFQVLLGSYPHLQLLLQKLEITNSFKPCYFDSGALLLKENKVYSISDPLQEGLKGLDSAFCPLFSIQDKLTLLKLRAELKTQNFEDILSAEQLERQQSIDFLREYGFSENIINDFFKPFFGGVFADKTLSTAANNLKFCFKAFGEKKVFIPANGVSQLIDSIVDKLPSQNLRKNAKVLHYNKLVDSSKFRIVLESGEELYFDNIIFAVDIESLCELVMFDEQTLTRQKYFNLYFKSSKSLYSSKKIFLNCSSGNAFGKSSSESVINNGVQISNITKSLLPESQKDEHLISVTVLKTNFKEEEIIKKATSELKSLFPSAADGISYLAKFCLESSDSLLDQSPENISTVNSIMNSIMERVSKGIFFTGEHTTGICSQETSIKSGFQAAKRVLKKLSS
ncbi:MAG: FAD-dependent oxidoreductase [Candidatus Caenarcaniphilales bacterium]|nr:FAD-dependent oxidoreductase [Candidatus Caenarcaniphilales bacterium]